MGIPHPSLSILHLEEVLEDDKNSFGGRNTRLARVQNNEGLGQNYETDIT